MKPDRCSFCKGKLVEGKTEFVAKVEEQIVKLKMFIMSAKTVGNGLYTPEVSRKIDIIMKKFHESKLLLHPVAAGELSLIVVTPSRVSLREHEVRFGRFAPYLSFRASEIFLVASPIISICLIVPSRTSPFARNSSLVRLSVYSST